MGLPLARLAEYRSRSLLLSISVAIFGVAAACCGFSTTFVMLVLCRIAVAIGDGGFSPIVGSLIGDHYPMNKRASAMSVIWFGAPVGAALGSIVGGWLAQNGGWRHWFFVLSVPALVIAVLCMLTLREPPRGMSDSGQAKGPPPTMKTALAFLLRKQAVEERKLSRAAIETLAIIAYHQPVTRAEIEDIRGVVTSKGTLDVLLETGWIRPRGRRKAPGRPVTYGTTEAFLSHFGLDAVGDLPGLDELKGSGLLDGRLPAGFAVPLPSDDASLHEDEDPLEPGDLDLGLAPPRERTSEE